MSRAKLNSLIGCLTLIVLGCTESPAFQREENSGNSFALIGVSIIDGRGGRALHDQTIVVRNGRIDEIAPRSLESIMGVQEIPSKGMYVIPGLWDSHAHTDGLDPVFDLYLLAGVTSIRDMGCDEECAKNLVSLRDSRSSQPERYPRMLVAGPMLDGASPYQFAFHKQVSLDTVASAIAHLQELNVDFVKVRDFLSPDEFFAIAEASTKAGLPFAGHVPISVPVDEAFKAGMLTAEHEGNLFGSVLISTSSDEENLRAEMLHEMSVATKRGSHVDLYAFALGADFLDRLVGSFDSRKADALAISIADSGGAIVPTLINMYPAMRAVDPVVNGRRLADDPWVKLVPDHILKSWQKVAATHVLGQPFSPADHEAMARHYQVLVDVLGRFHRAGVPILAGTDGGYPNWTPWLWPGFTLHDELALLVEAGLTPSEAIAAASGRAARHFGIEDVGTIEVGQVADLVLLSADPLADIRNTRRISDVIVGGIFVDRDAITERLESIEYQ